MAKTVWKLLLKQVVMVQVKKNWVASKTSTLKTKMQQKILATNVACMNHIVNAIMITCTKNAKH